MDSIFGMFWMGTHTVPAGDYKGAGEHSTLGNAWTNTNTFLGSDVFPCNIMLELYQDDIKSRYKELRDKGIFTTKNIVSLLKSWLDKVGYDNLKEDIEECCAYEDIPQTPSYRKDGTYAMNPTSGGFYNSITRVGKWLDEHFKYLDSEKIFNYNK